MLATVFVVVPGVMGLFLWRSYHVARKQGYEAREGTRRWDAVGADGAPVEPDGSDGADPSDRPDGEAPGR